MHLFDYQKGITLIEQFWFGTTSFKLLGVLRYPLRMHSEWGIIFFPGFGQTKAGSYFIFTRLAQQIAASVPAFQFDYRGWGDSEGESTICSLSSLQEDGHMAVLELKRRTGCKNLVFIGSGFGNWIAAMLGRQYHASLVLLAPYRSPILLPETVQKQLYSGNTLVDTASLGDWKQNSFVEYLFQLLGSGLNRAKGIKIQSDFLIELSLIDSLSLLNDYPGAILAFQPEEDLLASGALQWKTVTLLRSDSRLLNPMDRDYIEKEVISWINHIGGKER